MTTRMLQRRGDAVEWTAVNPILGDGEIGFERDTGELKIGDGVKNWVDLNSPYLPRKIVDAKGDLIVGTADNTPARLARGATGQQLTVQADGSLAWATPYAGADRVAKAGDTMTGQLNINSNVRFTVNGGGTVYAMSAGADGYVAGSLTALRIRGGTSGIQFTNNADGAFNLTIDDSGNIEPLGNVTIPNTKSLFLNQSSGNQAYIQGNGTTLKLRGGTSGVTIRNNADTTALLTVDNTGIITVTNTISVPNAKNINFAMSSGALGYIGTSGTVLQLRGGTGGIAIRNNADTASIAIFDDTGQLILHGSTAGLTFYGRDNDTQNFVNYVNGNIWRVYSSLAGSDRLTVEATGTVRIHGTGAALNLHGVDNDAQVWSTYTYQNVYRILNGTDKLLLDTNGTLTVKNTSASALALSTDAAVNTRGPEIAFLDTKAGQATPNKFIRAVGGQLQILNSAYTSTILILGDAGVLFAGGAVIVNNNATGGGRYSNAGLSVNTASTGNPGIVVQGQSGQTADFFVLQDNAAVVKAKIDAAGVASVASLLLTNATVQTSAVTGGAASALPSNPVGYLFVTINGTIRKIPYYS